MTDEELGFGSIAPHFQEEPKQRMQQEIATKPIISEKKPEKKTIADRQIVGKEGISPDFATNAVKKSMEMTGPAVAAEPAPITDSQSFMHDLKNVGIGSAGTLALLGLGAGGMYLYNKSKGGKPPDNTTPPPPPPPPPPGGGTPSSNQPVASSSGELPSEVLTSPGYKQFTALEEKSGGPITTATDLQMIQQSEANRIAKEQEALKKAQQAGVTPSTSLPEAQTLVATSEAAKDPVEKAQEKTIEGAAKPKATKAKNPVESMKNYLTGSQGFNEEQYNTLMKDILGKDLEMPSTGGGFGEKSHPEEWNKYMAWRKENIEGPKANLGFDIKKKFRDVEKIEDPKIRATARNALLVSLASLPAFLNAKTSKEMREARQGLGEAILPIGMTPTEAGAPTLPPNAFSESRKLGSPFRQQLMGVAPPAR
jgi:hypothetical protein